MLYSDVNVYDVVVAGSDPGPSGTTDVAAHVTTESTFTVTGVAARDIVLAVIKPTAPTANSGLVQARVSAANTVKVMFANAQDTTAITPGATANETWRFIVARPNTLNVNL